MNFKNGDRVRIGGLSTDSGWTEAEVEGFNGATGTVTSTRWAYIAVALDEKVLGDTEFLAVASELELL